MITRHQYKGGVWIDVENPSDAEVREIGREFQVGTRLENEILTPTPFPLVAADANATLLILHFPGHGAEDGEAGNQEVDFLVSDKFIITVRYEVIAPLHHLKKLLETQSIVEGKGNDSITTDVLLEVLFAHLYTSVRDHTNHIASRLEHTEREMFAGHERLTIRTISNISREYLHMEAALANHEEPLGRFLNVLKDRGAFNGAFAERAQHILTEHAQVARLVATHREVASELRETNIALLEARQNEIMKNLTVITFIVMPLELITLVFGMHAMGAPLAQDPNEFWIIVGAMGFVAICMTLFFVRKRWIF